MTDEVAALVESLRPVQVNRNGYSRTDRYRDFNRVFHGTPEGKRVLAQVLDLIEGPQVTEAELSNHALMAVRAWGRRTSATLLAWASVPPLEDADENLGANPVVRQRSPVPRGRVPEP